MTRIAWFSNLCSDGETNDNSAQSVSEYTTRLLLPILRERFDIEIFGAKSISNNELNVSHYLNAFKVHERNPFDLCFYQVEDGRFGHLTRAALGLMPGVVYFHDILFKDEGPEPFHYSPWRDILNLYYSSNAKWPERNKFPERDFPLGRRECALSFVPLFSSERNLSEYRRLIDSNIGGVSAESPSSGCYLPYPVRTERPTNDQIHNSLAVVASVRIEDRIHKVLPVVKKLGIKLNWLLQDDSRTRADELAAEFGVTNYKIFQGATAEKWSNVVRESDLALHMQFSSYGDGRHFLPISMISKVPVVVTNFGASQFLPDAVVLKINPGAGEIGELEAIVRGRYENSPSFEPLINVAYSYAVETHGLAKVANELADLLENESQRLKCKVARWELLTKNARMQLLNEVSLISARARSGSGLEELDILNPALAELGWS